MPTGLPRVSSMPQEVGVSSYLSYFLPKGHLIAWVFFGAMSGRAVQAQNFWTECWNV